MTKFVDEKTGAIKKHDLMVSFLENAPTIEIKTIKEVLKEYFGINKNTNYHLLNSKMVNYNQVFHTNGASKMKKVDHLIDYLTESGFVASQDGGSTVMIDAEAVFTPMTDIRDIEIDDDGNLSMYIGATYFTLTPADHIVETTTALY